MRSRRRWPAALLLTALVVGPASAGALPSALTALTDAGVIRSATFQQARATFSVWTLHAANTQLQVVFENRATVPGQAGQLRSAQLSVQATAMGRFAPEQRLKLEQAAATLARRCFGITLHGLGVLIRRALHQAASDGLPVSHPGRSSVVALERTDQGAELSVSVGLPAGQSPGCAMPTP